MLAEAVPKYPFVDPISAAEIRTHAQLLHREMQHHKFVFIVGAHHSGSLVITITIHS